ncbi:aminotransferase class IV [Winogradskyella bathintestinalis]|uniref:branched-chain-amino-acid transaminase n=1 Tax=Winogradskyella bathintestinalis TaxID=3035208 RepID=A0ABT7ZWJ7_9FLAO|nr:aminotransferase class IV [Winogradskyella bathintestinalis]MDN3493381.1 aminotransferase class IV [Winogradskyella bathintestinalis]
MINFNGTLLPQSDSKLTIENRGYKYGDALFETLKVVNGKIFFWEDHYFRLMSSMRILRMEIPMNFTMEFLESEILKTLESNDLLHASARVRLNVDRGEGGKYLPSDTTQVNFNIKAEPHHHPFYTIDANANCIVDLYKDYFVAPGLLSGLKSNNKAIQVIGSIYAKENDFDNCLVLNTNKSVIEALNGNLFLVKGDQIKTPPLEDGCLKGVMRKQILELLSKDVNVNVEEASISPFELQKADELFITNVIKGIVPITKYRKKTYGSDFAQSLVSKLNAKLRLL